MNQIPEGKPAKTPSTLDRLKDRLKREVLEIENRTDLTKEAKVSHITHITCATCAGAAVQPIPFDGIFILTPIQDYMGSRIAAIRGVPLSESEASTIIKEILAVIGLSFAAEQLAIGIWQLMVPRLGGFVTIPMVYALTYAIMRVMDAYLTANAANRKLAPEEIRNIWRRARAEGKERGNAHERDRKR